MMNSTILNGTTNELNGGMDMNVLTVKTNLERAIKEATGTVSQTLISGAKKALKGLNEGSRTEADIQMMISALKMGQRGAVIDTPELLMAFAKLLKAKEYITIMSIEIKRNKYGEYTGIISTTPAPIGRAYSEHTKEESILIQCGKSGFQTITENSFAPFTKDFISIKVKDKDDLKNAQDDGVKIVFAGRKTIACIYNRTKAKWIDIVSSKEYTKAELDAYAVEVEGDLRLQKAFVYSPSDVRNFSYACKDVTNGDDRDEYLNRISNGAWNVVKDEIEVMIAKGVDAAKIQLHILKSMPRFGQLKAGSVNLKAIKSWAYLHQAFETACGETIDGTGYFKASYVAEVFTQVLGIKVTESAVVGLFLQARPDLQKAAYEVLPDHVFETMLESIASMVDENGKKLMTIEGSLKSSMAPVMIVDKNVVKVESDYAVRDICLELLEIGGCSQANLSKQAFEKVLFANKKAATDYAVELGQNYMTDKFVSQFLEPTAKIPTIGEVKNPYAPNLMLAVAPQMITQSKPLFRANLNNTVQSFVNSIDKLKFTIAGNNVRLTSDAAEILLGKVGRKFAAIKYGELYMPAAVAHFRKEYKDEANEAANEKGLVDDAKKKFVMNYVDKKVNATRVCMIKYPSMGPKEFYLAKVLTLRTIYARINEMPLTVEEKKVLKDYYKATGKSVAKLPAVKLVMFQCAGLDYDYDGAEFIYDQNYVGILEKDYLNEATLIATMDEIRKEYDYNSDEIIEELKLAAK